MRGPLGRPAEVTIARRYRGPTHSGNGGYVCGIVASAVVGPVEVTLHAPPPLDTPLHLLPTDSGAKLVHGKVEIATARGGVVDISPPPAFSIHDAEIAGARYVGFDCHPYPECFVCGTQRTVGDGLRIFPGATGDKAIVAAVWIPAAQDADMDGHVAREVVWAALDCPGYFGLMSPGLPALPGRMSADIFQRPKANEPCVVVGWRLGQEGRKHFAASAIYSDSGAVLGVAVSTWIELRRGNSV